MVFGLKSLELLVLGALGLGFSAQGIFIFGLGHRIFPLEDLRCTNPKP